jgi:crotonyl-CoA reductase
LKISGADAWRLRPPWRPPRCTGDVVTGVVTDNLLDAARAGAEPSELLARPVPKAYRAAYIRYRDEHIFDDVDDKDVRYSLHFGEIPMPPLAPDEVLVALMASAVDYDTVRIATFEPGSSLAIPGRAGRRGESWVGAVRNYRVVGSDAAGVVVRVGTAVRQWDVGDRVCIVPASLDQRPQVRRHGRQPLLDRPAPEPDALGTLAEFTVARATHVVPKPPHLSWEEAACNMLCLGAAYRMLIGPHGARIKLGDVVLVWGGGGGLGSYAAQLVTNAGGIAVCVVSRRERADVLRALGCPFVLDRTELGFPVAGEGDPARQWRVLQSAVYDAVGEDPHVVVDPVGGPVFGASLFVVRSGGTVVTCAPASDAWRPDDDRLLCSAPRRVVAGRETDLEDVWESNRLLVLGRVVPALSRVYGLDDVAEAVRCVQVNEHLGKVGVLCAVDEQGLGIDDWRLRERVGEDRLRLFRGHALVDVA